jgi:hypothetical protein
MKFATKAINLTVTAKHKLKEVRGGERFTHQSTINTRTGIAVCCKQNHNVINS